MQETWPFYADLENYNRVRQEQEGKVPSTSVLLGDGSGMKSGLGGLDHKMGAGDSDDDDDDGSGDDDDEDGEAKKDSAQKNNKKRARASSGAAAAVAAAAQAAAASAYGTPGSSMSLHGAAALSALGQLSPELVSLLRPKEVSRKERDWATMLRTLTGALSQNIQDAHQVSTRNTHIETQRCRGALTRNRRCVLTIALCVCLFLSLLST